MRVTFVIGWVHHQSETTTTAWLAHEGHRRGHDVAFLDYLDFTQEPDGSVWGRTRRPAVAASAARARYVAALRSDDVISERRRLSDDDIVFLRNNPADRFSSWVERVGNPALAFGRLLAAQGVRVINSPDGLERARHPSYLTKHIPDLLPPSLISRDVAALERFLGALDGPAVLKPLGGYGGHGVFLVERGQQTNVRAMIEMIVSDGYAVAQPWIPAGDHGDKRVLLWRGRPLELGEGRWSAYLRLRAQGDHRNNIHAGASRRPCTLDEYELAVCRRVGDFLLDDGLDLVGLDLIGDRVLEINVFAPGGIHNMNALYGGNIAARIWDDLEASCHPAK